jgi:hypothetical protein
VRVLIMAVKAFTDHRAAEPLDAAGPVKSSRACRLRSSSSLEIKAGLRFAFFFASGDRLHDTIGTEVGLDNRDTRARAGAPKIRRKEPL